MQKKFYILGASAVLMLAVFLFSDSLFNMQEPEALTDYKNIEYIIDGNSFLLTDSVSELATNTIRYFGNEVFYDINDDGREDVVFIVIQDDGGTGTFFYAVAALNTEEGYVGSHGFFIGDRIAPQSTEVSQNPNHKNVIVINYADRAPGDPMTSEPSVGKSVWLKLDQSSMQFGVVVQNFEGEADPSRMSLSMKTWTWERALYNDGRIITPKEVDAFTLSFNEEEGRFSATTDCNGVGGNYTAEDGEISFSDIVSTRMYCEGSEEGTFTQLLNDSNMYHFTSKGELVLDSLFDSGSIIFR